ncbi:MAG: M20/M25/M40 family metallo-hydrolase [Candidatus Aminicenantes bacterium]|nr:M20/M25/M40 family metallo-hydrolase [Candidatus Aminicenantes bacterium]
MKRVTAWFLSGLVLWLAIAVSAGAVAQSVPQPQGDEQEILKSIHTISSHTLYDYVKELVSEKYGGRLTGTPEYDACADWVASLLEKWGIQPGGDCGGYKQFFPNPYTLVFPGGEVYLRLPVNGAEVRKYYSYEDEFIPGGTSGSGEVTAEVIYVGYGITAPELGYDDYAGVEVKDRILLMEREVPVSPDKDADLFKKWRPYSFHQYKLENAVAHGAKGMLYNYGPIGNPNNSYDAGFIYSHVGDAVVTDVFAGTGRDHKATVEKIRETLKPQSFATGKVFTIKNITEHHPDGIGANVIGLIEGSDPVLKDELIILGGHLDHLGRLWELMPGANDNATAVAVMLGVAEAISKCQVKPRRSVMFLFFGAEEQGVAGSEFYVNHPVFPLPKTAAFINMEGPGIGDKIGVLAGKNFPDFYGFLERANSRYIHRVISASSFANLARPRQDTARFLWKGVPSVTVGASETQPVERLPSYHNTRDNLKSITPEIMEDIAQLLFAAIMDMSVEPALNFRKQ